MMGVPRIVVDDAEEAVVAGYVCWLLQQRRLAELTVVNQSFGVRQFLAWRAAKAKPPLAELDPAELSEFVICESDRLSRGAVRASVSTLRCFVRYLFAAGIVDRDLSGVVVSPSTARFDGLPKGVDGETLTLLLDACDRDTGLGRRDFAILVLMSRLGLRAVEVSRMQLGDIAWRSGELLVRGKGGRDDRLPLPGDVGEALVDYLVSGRPAAPECRAVFLSLSDPPTAMSRNAVVLVSRRASRRAGLNVVGGHRLRHTAATGLLREGASLREVGQVLRHGGDAMTTSIYAKVDARSLGAVVRAWPGVQR
jgi:integrase/recombinase XerD